MKYLMPKIQATSPIWCVVMGFAGVGSTLLGPLLPYLYGQWHLHDHQAGMLAGCLFFGSFSGTLAMSEQLQQGLRRGACLATLGCLLFAWSTYVAYGFEAGMLGLVLMGFGLGQLMSSLNLLVGAAPVSIRVRQLAELSAAWCIGAVLSPCLSTVLVARMSASARLGLFAPLYLLPLFISPAETHAAARPLSHQPAGWSTLFSVDAMLCTIAFLIYGGIEASISAWVPVFATRYTAGPLVAAQWVVSIFWFGLIVGRLLMARFASHAIERFLLRIATFASVTCLLWLLVSPNFALIVAAAAVMGMCLSPLFPLLLSFSLSGGYSNRIMGVMLACCALGSALFPWLLGILSSAFSLRAGMMLPVAALVALLIFRWNPTRWVQHAV
jgi:fucose permease